MQNLFAQVICGVEQKKFFDARIKKIEWATHND